MFLNFWLKSVAVTRTPSIVSFWITIYCTFIKFTIQWRGKSLMRLASPYKFIRKKTKLNFSNKNLKTKIMATIIALFLMLTIAVPISCFANRQCTQSSLDRYSNVWLYHCSTKPSRCRSTSVRCILDQFSCRRPQPQESLVKDGAT